MIVVIGILAAITIVAFNGIQQRARDAQRQSDFNAIATAASAYRAERGSFLATGGGNGVGDGWFNGGDPTVLAEFQAAGYLTGARLQDPVSLTAPTNSTTTGYLIAKCGTGSNERTIIYGRLESKPAASLPSELSDCAANARGWWTTYGANFYKAAY